MLAKVKSFGLIGIHGYQVDVEVDIAAGLPGYDVVGLGDTAVKEGGARVKSAIKNSRFHYPTQKITVNLAPADTKKEGAIYDLAIAAGILSAANQLNYKQTQNFVFLGELSLDGSVRKINGVLPILIAAKEKGEKTVMIPAGNANEAGYVEGILIYAISSLNDLNDFFAADENRAKYKVQPRAFADAQTQKTNTADFKFIQGQYTAKRALEIAAAGGHNVLLMGPPGSGKTMLAKAFPTILPNLSFSEALEVTKIHSIAGVLDASLGIVASRPIRSPHHTASAPALTGGGVYAKPGEISLAHRGVLFLDEFPEYNRNVLETLRQPLEDGVVVVSRVSQTIEYPANFILLASMNPCPCGNYGSKKQVCRCSPVQIHKYLAKISGPLMDRIDLHIECDSVEYDDLTKQTAEEVSSDIKARVDKARTLQNVRYGNKSVNNAKMPERELKTHCKLNAACEQLLKDAFNRLKLSARAYTRIIKVARTIADLEDSKDIEVNHIAEAIQYRSLDTKYW